jgi:predicted dehydrogenase
VTGVAIIGCGYWGPNLVRNFSENLRSQVVAVSDMREERLRAIEPRVPGARLTTDAFEAINDPAVHAVVVSTPVSTHHDVARAAFDAGKHVLVTKPLAASTAECNALIEHAGEAGRVLMVDHTFVYTAAVQKMRELIAEGALGELYYFDSVRVNLGLFQHDVNVIWDLAAHDLSIIRFLVDAAPTTVNAVGTSHSGSGLEDVAYVTLRFDSDLIAHCHLNWLSPVKIRQTLIGGSERMLVWDDLVPDEKIRIYDRGITKSVDPGVQVDYRIGDAWMPHLDRTEALATEVDHFLDCIEQGAEPITGGAHGRDVVRLLEATSESLRLGGEAVSLVGTVSP